MSNPLLAKPREIVVELLPGDFEPRLQELQRQMTEAVDREAASNRFGASRSQSMKLAKEYDALLEQAQASDVVTIHVRPAGRAWRMLKDEHPPRKDNVVDEALGVNRATFFDDALRLCIDPVSDEDYAEFVERSPEHHWNKLCSAAWTVNEDEARIPKSSAVSLLRQMSEDASKSAASSE